MGVQRDLDGAYLVIERYLDMRRRIELAVFEHVLSRVFLLPVGHHDISLRQQLHDLWPKQP